LVTSWYSPYMHVVSGTPAGKVATGMTELRTATTPQAPANPPDVDVAYDFDVLVLDSGCRQSLASTRSLGRAGLRIVTGESSDLIDPAHPALSFGSRYSVRSVVLPSFAPDVSVFAAAVIDFVREHRTQVILAATDRVIGALLPCRDELAALGSTLALGSDEALAIANDKDRTLEAAGRLGIEGPRSLRIDSLDDLPAVLSAFTFPFVLKPTASWKPLATGRLQTVEVLDEAEVTRVATEFLSAGAGVVAQDWVNGRRDAIGLFVAGGEVHGSFACVMHRTTPTIGGVSAVRESVPMPADIYDQAVRLVTSIGLEGPCEVEFRRDAHGRPFLMEINARLAGPTETAMLCGVDFPLMLWQWAAGLPVERSADYRTGVRMRWLRGDLRWLWNNFHEAGRPDSVSRGRALWTFLSEFGRTRRYDCVDRRDLRPFIAELRSTAVQAITGKRPE
jgi:predicted ATP-grasp superfamily ATP-dependent carboligase